MRILSPTSDVLESSPLPLDAKNAESTINEETSTSTLRTLDSTVPTVVLDTDVVSDNMAARLCTSFLSHILFLKNQTPFPIVQLARMPTSDQTSRAAKKRHELLSSFDTLASHLYTTFIALSTAFALRGTSEKLEATGEHRGLSRAFFAVALGSTIGTAKSRVLVGVDGLETKVWGLENGVIPTGDVSEDGENVASETASDTDDDQSDGEERSCGSQDEEEYNSGSDDDASPPPSRSPSPAPSSSDSDASPSTIPENAFSSLDENPETIRAAERLLSRTLANACAEDDGQGLAAEMAPTQIHVLLRAPRRFEHPAWIPRQNLCASFDGSLRDFLVASGHASASPDTGPQKRSKANKIQGIWITTSKGNIYDRCTEDDDVAEEDELIWWSWDGKLVGFADW